MGGKALLFQLGENSVDVDVSATRALYRQRNDIYKLCYCPSCRNYEESMRRLDKSTAAFFRKMGVAPERPEEAWAYLPGEEQGTQHYWCLFPLVQSFADIKTPQSFQRIEDGLLAGFEERDGQVYLVLDWVLNWVRL